MKTERTLFQNKLEAVILAENALPFLEKVMVSFFVLTKISLRRYDPNETLVIFQTVTKALKNIIETESANRKNLH